MLRVQVSIDEEVYRELKKLAGSESINAMFRRLLGLPVRRPGRSVRDPFDFRLKAKPEATDA